VVAVAAGAADAVVVVAVVADPGTTRPG
jgi:hypothetical protein